MFGGLFGGFGSPATSSNTERVGTPGGFSLGIGTTSEPTASRWGFTLGTSGTASTGTRGCGGFSFDGSTDTHGGFPFTRVTTAETSAPKSTFPLGTQGTASTGTRGSGGFSSVGGTDTHGGSPFGRVTTAETSAPKSTFLLGTQGAASTGTRGCGGFSSVGSTDTHGGFPFGRVTTAETKAPRSSFTLGTPVTASIGTRGGCGYSFVGGTDTHGAFPFGRVTTAETKASRSSFTLGTPVTASPGTRGCGGFSFVGATDTYGGFPFRGVTTAETTASRSGFTLGTPGTASTGTRGGGGLLFEPQKSASKSLRTQHLENYINTVKAEIEEMSSLVFRSSQNEPQTSVTDSFVDAHENLDNSISMTTISPERQSILTQIQQLQDDEEIARVLQEEMDSEFARRLQGRMGTGHHSAMSNPPRVEQVKTTQHQSGTMGHRYNVLSHGNHDTSISETTMSSVTHSACTQIQQLQDDEEVPRVLQEEMDRDSALNVQGSIGASHSGAIGHTGAMSSPSRVEPVSAVKHRPNHRRRRRNGTNQKPIRNYEHGLKSQEVDELSIIPCKKQKTESDAVDECNICMDIYEEDHEKKYLPCCHYFHVSCIDKWLRKKTSCPVCRVDINADVNTPASLL